MTIGVQIGHQGPGNGIAYFDGNPNGTVDAPLGYFIINLNTGILYQQQSSPSGTVWSAYPSGAAGASSFIVVPYIAVGGETDVMVPIGSVMLNDLYTVSPPAIVGDGTLANPVVQLPNTLAGDRTTTEFRLICTAGLEAGLVLNFIIFAG